MRQKTRNILLGAAALFGALTCAHRAGAAFIYTDAAAFDAALDRVHVETFESMATGADVFTLPFDTVVTGDVSYDSKVKTHVVSTGGVEPVGGNRAWTLTGGTTTIALSGLDVNAFGLHYIDRGPVIFTISLIGATTETTTVTGGASGFLGLVGTDAATHAVITWTNAQGQSVKFDGVRVGWVTPAPIVVPAPRSMSLGLAGLAIIAWPRRR